MKRQAKFLLLGTGGSMGIPVIACKCSVCTSADPHDKRMRTSALLSVGDRKILIDCGPDFHAQALRYGIDTLSGVILTHGHYDHTAGIDELRVYHLRTRAPLPCLLSQETAEDIKQRFGYIFRRDPTLEALTARVELQIFPAERGDIDFLGVPIHYFTYEQAHMKVNGLRFGDLAYVTDIRMYPETIFEDLKGVHTLILSALRHTPSHLHFCIDEAVEFAHKVQAKQTWLTHLAHEVQHASANAALPENVKLGYDGLELSFDL